MQHNGKLDKLRAGLEILEGGAFGHNQTLVRSLLRLKQSSSDKTPTISPREQVTLAGREGIVHNQAQAFQEAAMLSSGM